MTLLNPEGVGLNPITNKVFSDRYRELAKFWTKLPAYKKAHQVIDGIKNDQVILITSYPGSGKTLLTPRYALEALEYKGKVGLSMPKQILTVSNASFQAEILDVELGRDIGYLYRGSPKNFNKPTNKLVYSTHGVIVSKVLRDPELREFDVIIIDEVHERSMEVDFLLYLLRQTCQMRPDFKLVVMSATVNQDLFAQYFRDFKYKHIDVGGERNYPVESIFLQENLKEDEYANKGFEIIKEIIDRGDEGDIMFFITSVQEAYNICRRITETFPDVLCIEVYSGISDEVRQLVQDKELFKAKYPDKNRKIVLATNVAESSLTVDGIKFVIDSGYELSSGYDYRKRSRTLSRRLISQAQAKQRMGRSGRTGPGKCYHLYTESTFERKMDKYPQPSIRTDNIVGECLGLLAQTHIKTTEQLKLTLDNFIEPPPRENVEISIEILEDLGLISQDEITSLGKIVADMKTDPQSGLALYISYHANCLREMVVVLSMLEASKGNLQELFNVPNALLDQSNTQDKKYVQKLKDKFDKARNKIGAKNDVVSILRIYSKYKDLKKINQNRFNTWLYESFLNLSTLEKAERIYYRMYNNIMKVLEGIDKIEFNFKQYNIEDRLGAALLVGYSDNLLRLSDDKKTYSSAYLDGIKLSKDSWYNFKKLPKVMLCLEVFTIQNQPQAMVCMEVTPGIKKVFQELSKVMTSKQ